VNKWDVVAGCLEVGNHNLSLELGTSPSRISSMPHDIHKEAGRSLPHSPDVQSE
jgi:hypothetical protein